MKLIKWLAIWLALGVAVLYGLAGVVDRGFAEYWAKGVLAVCAGMGVWFGLAGVIRAGKEKRRIRTAMEYMAGSRDRCEAWASDAKQRATQVWGKCHANGESLQDNPLFAPEYTAEDILNQITDELAVTAELQSAIRAAVETMEEEGGAA